MFTRSTKNPILKPNPNNWWEAKKLYNPGVIFDNGKYHMYYRAVGQGEDWKSSIGYAISDDGENFQRFNEPILVAENELEKRGLEDPRITKIDDLFYMSYASYDGITPKLSIATSENLKNWIKKGFAFSNWKFEKAGGKFILFDENGSAYTKSQPNEWSKSGAIFPEKINDKFYLLFGEYKIWFATSNDRIKWEGQQTPFLEARQGNFFDNTFIEMGPPPIKTEKGWLILYHGIDDKMVYRLGYLLLDLNDPTKILYRSNEPIFEPSAPYELEGVIDITHNNKPKVVFCCGAVLINNILRIYYGAGDSVVCTASTNINNLLKNI